jgi:hypothetical protein
VCRIDRPRDGRQPQTLVRNDALRRLRGLGLSEDAAPSPLRTPPVEGDERADYSRRLIAARCPELTEGETEPQSANWRFNDADATASAAPVMMIPRELAERIEAALEAITDRMDRIEDHILRSEAEGRA